jgi:hypothetical protein
MNQTINSLFINNPLLITRDTNVYGNYINQDTYDYTFLIDLTSTNGSSDITKIFTNASFRQNSNNSDLYNIKLVINQASIHNLWTNINNKTLVTVLQGQSNIAFGTLKPTVSERIGDRLLEIVAHKLFGHGQARAAISNDLEFYTHDATMWDHLSNSLANDNFAHDIFNQYVASNRYAEEATRLGNSINSASASDVDNWVNFNFSGFTFDYPLYVNGVIKYDNSIQASDLALLKNGPNVGGTKLVNGAYNIPVLVKFACNTLPPYSIITNNISGNIINTNNSYTILKFIKNDTLIVSSPVRINYLIVAGGGAGGYAADRTAGGGGAGGYIVGYTTLQPGTYPITIGSGGTSSSTISSNGGNSIFNSLTAVGGGVGGSGNNLPGNGGSGGGGYHGNNTAGNNTTNQGNVGGIGFNNQVNYFAAGGGGGAGSVGNNGTNNGGGDSGEGITISNSNLQGFNETISICGGGGGAVQVLNSSGPLTYGLGKSGGGNGGMCMNGVVNGNGCIYATSATTYGSGGGGGVSNYTNPKIGGSGFSGIVIITYNNV